jgi:hypothetical protein
MIAALLLYVCASSLLDNCEVYVEHTWEGPTASVECNEWLRTNRNRVPLLYRQRGEHVFYVCDTQSAGE